jgi:cell division protein FtsB
MNSTNKEKNINNARSKKYTFWLVLILIFIFFVFSDHGIYKRIQLEMNKRELNKKIDIELKRKDSLNQQIKRLLIDTNEIERIAREKYGMIKPGEEVIIIDREKK